MEKTINQLKREFEIIATEHRQINDFFFGDFIDAVSRDAVSFPIMIVIPADSANLPVKM